MARYERKNPAPVGKDYRRYRADVRQDFRTECAHCLVIEFYAAGAEAMELDHFRPQNRFPELRNAYRNIVYSCSPCNGAKSDTWPSAEEADKGYGFVDLCEDDSSVHYELDPDGLLIPLTASARYTILKCRLNRAHLCRLRRALMEAGEFRI